MQKVQQPKSFGKHFATAALMVGVAFIVWSAGVSVVASPLKSSRPHHRHRWKPMPLVSAVKANNVPLVRQLLASGSLVNARDDKDFSPLGWATITKHKEVAHLRQHGATFGNPYSKDGTDLGLAATWGSILFAQRLLVEMPESKAKREDERTAVLNAAYQGHADMMRFLLKNGARVNPKNRDSELALWWAAEQGCDDAAKILLDHGISPNARDEHGNSVLIAAVVSGHENLVRAVLAHGADVTLRGSYISDRGEDTALSVATQNGSARICEILRKAGAKA